MGTKKFSKTTNEAGNRVLYPYPVLKLLGSGYSVVAQPNKTQKLLKLQFVDGEWRSTVPL
jgi:hypothetical protein